MFKYTYFKHSTEYKNNLFTDQKLHKTFENISTRRKKRIAFRRKKRIDTSE